MKALELFCGTKCVGKELEKLGYEVISLDFEEKFEPTICEDITKWDYEAYDPLEFDIIWASPECKTFSIASGGKHRLKTDIMGFTQAAEEGNKMIDSMLEIMKYFKPKKWFVENPRGLLKYYPAMKVLGEPTLVFYGNHGWAHPKPTHIWSNVKLWDDEKKPIMSPDLWYRDTRGNVRYKAFARSNHTVRSKIPQSLIKKLLTYFVPNETFLG